MPQNITSVLDKNEILANEVASADVLYLIHGTGSNRDRFIKIAELLKVFGSSQEDLTVSSITFTDGTSTYAMELDSDGRIVSYAGLKTDADFLAKGSNYDVEVRGNEGVLFKTGTGNSRTTRAYVKYDKNKKKMFIFAEGEPNIEEGGIGFENDVSLANGKYLFGNIKTNDIYPRGVGINSIKVHGILTAPNVPSADSDIDLSTYDTSSLPNYMSMYLMSSWGSGVERRIINRTGSDHTIATFVSNSFGSASPLKIEKNSYVKLLCVGSFTYAGDNKDYAITIPCGGHGGV